MKRNYVTLLLLAAFAISCGSSSSKKETSESLKDEALLSQKAFLNNLASLCGKTFVGQEDFIREGRESWSDKEFVMHVTVCDENKVHIPFHLSEDHSRTWQFTLEEQGLRFRHDHRYPDGTPEEKNLYGGYADGTGTAFWQNFPSDEYTLEMLADDNNRQWRVELAEDFSLLTYQLYYSDDLLFQASFDLTAPL